MDYIKLGNSGLEVSRLCLGCMGFGDPQKWIHPWVIDEESSRQIVKQALDMGITFFDTANVYSGGTSEAYLGRALKDYAKRDDVVIATKVYFPTEEGPNKKGLSRKAILSEIDKSLQNLGTDYIDLYQIHRWDFHTPIEETMETLHDLIKMGKVRYIGASSMMAWQFLKANHVSEKHQWTRFVSMQNHYNLLYREEEREMLPLCQAENIAVIPYSPLASGRLTRDWTETTHRSKTDEVQKAKYDETADKDRLIVETVATIAENRGVKRSQVALAWLLHKAPITSPIIGATKTSHLEDAVGALSLTLSSEEITALEAHYVPHPISGFHMSK